MKRKRIAALLLACLMVFGLTACGGGKTSEGSASKEDVPAENASEGNEPVENAQAGDDGLYNIVMEILTIGENPSGLQDVEDAINAIVEEELGVTVTLFPIPVMNATNQVNMMLTSGEKIDLIFNMEASDRKAQINKGMLIPLDDLYEQYGGDIKTSQGIAVQGGYYQGSLYGIPAIEVWGIQNVYGARSDMLEELGFEVDPEKIYTIDELEALFASFKEHYGEGYYCVNGITSTTDLFASLRYIDTPGGSRTNATGVLMGAGLDDNTEIVNLYATEEYAAYAQRMYEWAQKGYIAPDAATNTESAQLQMQSGKYLGGFGNGSGDAAAVSAAASGIDMTTILIGAPYMKYSNICDLSWSIPVTCENPEKTFQFLNLLYEVRDLERDVDTLLTLGLENVSYEFVERGEGSRGIIDYPEGVNANNTPYNMALGIYGDKNSQPKWKPLTMDFYKDVETFNEEVSKNGKTCTIGYVFDSSSVATEIAAVESVMSQYVALISSGALNPDEVLPEFIEALNAGGIDKIIAENQKQLDAWLAGQQ